MESNLTPDQRKIIPLSSFHNPDLKIQELHENKRIKVKSFNDKVASFEIPMKPVACLCGGTKFDLIARTDRYGFAQDTVLCQQCGLILSNPRMASEYSQVFYSSDTYREIYEDEDLIKAATRRYELKSGSEIHKACMKFVNANNFKTVFEFGAGGGWNLNLFKESGLTVSGMDYSSGLSKFAQEHGIHVAQGGLDHLPAKKFDLVILNHVYEHFFQPITELKKLADLIAPNGMIYIGVPNIDNFGMGQLQNAHNYYFNKTTFLHYVSLSGLEPVEFCHLQNGHMYGIFKKGQNQNSELSLKGNYLKTLFKLKVHYYKQLAKGVLKPVLGRS